MLYQIKIGPPWPPPKNFSRGGPNSARGGPKKFFGALRAPKIINSNLISNLAPPWIFLKIRPWLTFKLHFCLFANLIQWSVFKVTNFIKYHNNNTFKNQFWCYLWNNFFSYTCIFHNRYLISLKRTSLIKVLSSTKF